MRTKKISEGDSAYLSVRVPEALKRAVKAEAARSGMTVQEYGRRVYEQATGGEQPSFDPEAEDFLNLAQQFFRECPPSHRALAADLMREFLDAVGSGQGSGRQPPAPNARR